MQQKNTTPNWHYDRTELAQSYVKQFDAGLTSARALFGRRRMGKTEFLNMDLVPVAQKAKYTCIYVNLWECQANPMDGIRAASLSALQQQASALARAFKGGPHISQIKLSVLGTGVDAKLEEASAGMETLWKHIDAHKNKLLLLIDEAQVLAADQHKNFSGSLRAGLDVRKASIKVIFTGSSEQTLRSMFGKPSMAFYNWAPIEPFPLLDHRFVSHMVTVANSILQPQYRLQDAQAQVAFLNLKSSPEVFRRFIESYMVMPFEGVDSAVEAARARTFSVEGYASIWAAMPAIDRLILQFVTAKKPGITGAPARKAFGKSLGLDEAVALHTVNNALARLLDPKRQMLVKLELGVYQFEDQEFADWVQLELPAALR
jgi:hypothetical protein